MRLHILDAKLVSFCKRMSLPFARFALFVVFFWFGLLKVVGMSPASSLVEQLFNSTIPFMQFGTFLILFGIFECLIGILFIIPKAVRIVIPLLVIHMITTFGPLFLLPEVTWSGFLVPTMEGQYIIKNLLIIAIAISIASHVEPLHEKGV